MTFGTSVGFVVDDVICCGFGFVVGFHDDGTERNGTEWNGMERTKLM